MKLTTLALAIAFTVPTTFALARGGTHIGSHVTRPSRSPQLAPALRPDPETSLGMRFFRLRMIRADLR